MREIVIKVREAEYPKPIGYIDVTYTLEDLEDIFQDDGNVVRPLCKIVRELLAENEVLIQRAEKAEKRVAELEKPKFWHDVSEFYKD